MSAGALVGIAVCALCASVFGALVKRSNREYALLLTAAAAVLMILNVLEKAGPLAEQIASLTGSGQLQGECLGVMLKAVGLTVTGQLAARMCKDAGESALAYGVELATKVAVLAASMPVLAQLFQYLGEIISL
ncbi:stage III sporulation AC/AD family protein [Acutalibacter intestini]|uniref:stage III sporulation AC/AD family protein n=1 Tax=Acutalibacter intestini TaxID=3093659 RepID=UPI002AC9D078|nr:stage III sporulation AC/AD family protein [Acutalibacter sp. M00204]